MCGSFNFGINFRLPTTNTNQTDLFVKELKVYGFVSLFQRMGTREENMFVWEGSQVQLRCIVQNTIPENLGKLSWYKNGVHMDKMDPFSRNVVFQVSFCLPIVSVNSQRLNFNKYFITIYYLRLLTE